MALPATLVFNVRSDGSDTQCGGGFNSARGGTDYTLQAAAQATGTVTSATTTVTATTGIFTSQMVGNVITDGTTFKEITAFTSATVVTVDSAPSWSGATIFVGGAFVSPGKAGSIAVAGNDLNIKSATYSVTSASNNVAGGCVSWPAQSAAANTGKISGYGTTPGDFGTAPVLQASGAITAFTLITLGTGNHVENLSLDCASKTTSRALNASNGTVYKVKAANCTNNGIVGGECLLCEVTGCSSQVAFAPNQAYFCFSHDNTTIGIAPNTGVGVIYGCISANNTGATTDGFNDAGGAIHLVNCTAYGNGRDGLRFTTAAGGPSYSATNCIFYGNTGWGVNDTASNDSVYLINCAFGTNTAGATTGITSLIGSITLTANPFTNAAGNDFSLNNTAGGGLLVRAAGQPATFLGSATPSYLDVGAAQHQDSSSFAMMFL